MNDTQKQSGSVIVCSECDTPLALPQKVVIGTVVECAACAIESECVSLPPLTFVPLEQEK